MPIQYYSTLAAIFSVLMAGLLRCVDGLLRPNQTPLDITRRFNYFDLPQELRDQTLALVVIEADANLI